MRWITDKFPLSFVVVSSTVFLVTDVTLTWAPDIAFPCGSVTVPIMLPKTACPTAVLAPNPSARQRTRTNPRTACFFITLLLSTPNSSHSNPAHRFTNGEFATSSAAFNSYRIFAPAVSYLWRSQNENGINDDRSIRPVSSEQPPNSSHF